MFCQHNCAKDRKYVCKECGFSTHRDRLSAINILNVPVADGVA
ncbi:MAG TPA: transposase [Clostridiaceae bacterium]|nr:transposase [Clostridiaceae bacterium]